MPIWSSLHQVDSLRARRAALLGLLCAGLLTAAGCSSNNKEAEGGEAGVARAAEAQPVEVRTAAAETREVPAYLEATGTITADEQSDVAPEVSGQVVGTPVDVGAFVRKGDVIARLDERDARLRLQQAQAGIRQAQANLAQAQARLGLAPNGRFDAASIPEVQAARATLESAEAAARLAETNARRYANLLESGDVARSVYDQSRTQAETATAQASAARQQYEAALNQARGSNQGIQTTEAALSTARSQLALAQKAVNDSIVRAPFAGYISDRPIAVGEYVTPASRIATVVRTNPVKLILQVPEAEAGRVRQGLTASANVSGYSDRQFSGRITAINPAVDPTSRVLSVEVTLDNPQNMLRPGMFATGRITQAGGVRGIFLPGAAVQTNQNLNSSSVYVIDRESGGGEQNGEVVRLLVVQRGEEEGDFVRILSGLQGGETVVVGNTENLYDGARVTRR